MASTGPRSTLVASTQGHPGVLNQTFKSLLAGVVQGAIFPHLDNGIYGEESIKCRAVFKLFFWGGGLFN